MNREEILAKSRQENKNRDVAEISQTKDASRFAINIQSRLLSDILNANYDSS